MKKSKDSDYIIIKNDVLNLVRDAQKTSYVQYIKKPLINENCIGYKLSHHKKNNYINEFEEINNLNYAIIELNDESFITFHYKFEKERLVSHSLSYFPHPDYLESKSYIRIDYSKEGVEEEVHTSVHMHIDSFDDSRLAINRPLTPSEFLRFVLIYIYKVKDITFKTSYLNIYTLSKKELKNFYLTRDFD